MEYPLVCWKVELDSYCGSMLRCILQRATNLKNVEKGERQSDPLASITFRGKMCRMDLGGEMKNLIFIQIMVAWWVALPCAGQVRSSHCA